MEKVFTTAYSAFIHSSCYFGTVQRTRGVERLSTMLRSRSTCSSGSKVGLCSATERGEVLLSYLRIFTRGSLERHTSAPLVDESRLSPLLLRGSLSRSVPGRPLGHYSPWEWFGHQATLWGRGPDW
ncbi:hypothetical protein RND71_043789 [Anisodus tanguticus]|uniref:Uncharacterized protein n=1 Tax=Anisodus tanguticus TaxID=243964 RepID=A0AAE1UNN4_9SOLA|nr:hypothetical protein RND71_043789 [Anisodus tanguticus]